MHAHVALCSPPFSTLTYALPPEMAEAPIRPGLRVAVPLGGPAAGGGGRGPSLRMGVILDLLEESDLPPGVACRSILWPLETEPLLSGDLVPLARDLAARQGVTPGAVWSRILPAGLRAMRERLHLAGNGGATRTIPLKGVAAAEASRRAEWMRALLAGSARMLPAGEDAAASERCILRVDPPWPVRPAARRQRAILDHLHDHGPVPRRILLRVLGQESAQALRILIGRGCVSLEYGDSDDEEPEDALLPPPPAPFELNDEQEAAAADLAAALDAPGAATRLLFGVTGSGKTAVYLATARACLERGRSIFLLAPEVALAHKLRRDIAALAPDLPAILFHGYQTPARREDIFRRLAGRKSPCIVVGTRSSLFLPAPGPGCIILDEEHDASYKQDEIMPYHAREVAWFRMAHAKGGGLLVLGSATPDIRTFHAAKRGAISLLRLSRRVEDRPLPAVELVDMTSVPRGDDGPLAPRCEEALRETIARGEQAVVLLNRRGYAPVMYCLECGGTPKCPQCELPLTYHKGRERLLCHYCGHSMPFPAPCPACGAVSWLPMGEGTERVAERLSVLAGAPVLRLDRDSTRRPGRMEEILSAFAHGESPILVGTQMLSKGHHFPMVTLAVVADGDVGLSLPDYRAAERSFQLLLQSAGRAGRGELPGRVLVQTREPGHYCWRHVIAADYEGFYAEELARRERHVYPPFTRLALIRISRPMDDDADDGALQALARVMRDEAKAAGVRLLGPAPAPLALLRGRRRHQCLLKGGDWAAFRRIHAAARACPESSKFRIALDLDPVDML